MENIAVIGIANLFPGSHAADDFWQALLAKKDCRSKATRQQMGVEPERYFGSKGDTDKYYCMHGGYIRDFVFDATGYCLPADYLAGLDDLYQWALYVARTALDDAGYLGSDKLARCGAILGNLSFPTKSSNQLFLPLYHQAVQDGLQQLLAPGFQLPHYTDYRPVHPDNGLIAGYPAALLARALGLGGSHFALDAACASSCYSAKIACDYLATGQADMMLAGAVSAADPMFVNMGFSIFQAYPGNGISAPLDSQSQGLFAGEGAGMMLLKRHSDALRDGDTVYAIIKGGGLSNDGKGEFVLSPNSKGQVLVYERAYRDAGVDPADVAYVECHATGTPKGDRVELNSMETFFSRYDNKPVIGSVKSNLGHLLTAAGMPGMMKAIYALNEQRIPPTIKLQQPLSSKNGYFSAAQMPTETISWPRQQPLRTAGVSVFGFGGSNAHIVLQQSDAAQSARTPAIQPAEPLAITGVGAHFAGAGNLAAFRRLLASGETALRQLPEQRWKGLQHNRKVMQALGLDEPPVGGYIDRFDMDFLRFRMPPNEKDQLIPQQLLMMDVADQAALDANLQPGSNVAVLVAMGVELELHQYRGRVNLASQVEDALAGQGIVLTPGQQQQLADIAKDAVAGAAQLNQYTSFIGNIMASRISSLWDFSGPAITVSAEENSVFRCIELAESLFRTSEVEAVIIAAVDLAGSIENITLRSQFAPLASQPADDILAQQGWLPGEGAGAMVVQQQSKADPARCYAYISSLAFCRGVGADSLQQAASDALARAGIAAADVAAIEAYAGGMGDENRAEITAMQSVYPGKPCDSVKRIIGHTFAASGMASLLRAALVANDSGAVHIGVNGLGRDDSAVHLIVSGSGAPRTAQPAVVQQKAQLMRSIVLGGAAIEQQLLAAHQHPAVQAARAAMPASPVTLAAPLRLDNIMPATAGRRLTAYQPAGVSRPEPVQPVMTQKPQDTRYANSALTPALAEQQLRSHAAFLAARNATSEKMAELIALQLQISAGKAVAAMPATIAAAPATASVPPAEQPAAPQQRMVSDIQLIERYNQPANIIFNQADLVEFAEGDIARVFGPEYAIIDSYKRRVRLPTTDYLLVTRVTDLDATINEYKPSYMATEYDIPVDAPFLIDGQIPWSVSVESGQCDLMLISYLGIDFMCKGERVYRLLDCQLTFLDDMAFGGETLRYEIHIDSYARNGDQFLFFFHYDCYVNGKKVLIMRNGCAGFFTDEELDEGKGVILNDKDKAEIANAQKRHFAPLIANSRTRYEFDDMMKLVNGDVAGCFGPAYDQGGLNPSLKFSSQKFLMIERVTRVEPHAGPWGLGVLEGQKRLEPHHWYFPCHFKDDQVMAGSLMSEGCGQLAMFYMLWLGMHKNVKNARFQPVPGEAQTVRCRGQVTPQSNTLTYRMTVTDIGMHPYPFMKANIDIILDGKVVVDFKNLSVMIKEQDANHPYAAKLPAHLLHAGETGGEDFTAAIPAHLAEIEQSGFTDIVHRQDETGKTPFANVNAPLMWVESDLSAPKIKGVTPIKHVEAPMPTDPKRQNRVPDSTPFTPWHLFEFATGDIANCFGPAFNVYQGRIPPRTPCGDLQLVTQVLDVKGQRGDLKNLSSCVAEYEVPHDAWYFTRNSHPAWMPYSILMEISLQPNGFISGYMGTTLKYPEKDLFFRNLDGTGTLLKQIDLRGKTITNKSVMLSTSIAGGSIIQSFTFELLADGERFYEGKAVFGYFGADALANQLGIDNGRTTNAWFVDNNTPEAEKTVINLADSALALYQAPQGKPHYHLAGGQMNFVDTVTIVEGGGKHGKGYIFGERTIDATDWFFRYHFHQDPVMPGSLGVEAIIELLQTYALHNDLGKGFKNPRFIAPLSTVVWKYRGQITPENRQMALDVHISEIVRSNGEVRIIGDANLSKDGLRIYEVKDIVLSIVEA